MLLMTNIMQLLDQSKYLTPLLSKAWIPVIVVPPGEQTSSLRAPGCFPVSNTILAAPRTVCAANEVAISRGMPILTAPSDSASIIRYIWKIKAGNCYYMKQKFKHGLQTNWKCILLIFISFRTCFVKTWQDFVFVASSEK